MSRDCCAENESVHLALHLNPSPCSCDKAEIPLDIPGHERGCIWEVKRTCICDILWQTRRDSYNEGWNDGFDEGSMWIGVDVNGSNS